MVTAIDPIINVAKDNQNVLSLIKLIAIMYI
jgi:hypothetical protein